MNPEDLRYRKGKEKIIMLTAYDFQFAKIIDACEIDLILVGDSLGNVIQGYKDTKSVSIDDMLYHTRAVARGAKKTGIIGDMSIDSDRTPDEALRNAKRLIEAGAHAVKLEGYKPDAVKAILDGGISVMGHVGMLPQSVEKYRVKGKLSEEAESIFNDAIALDRLGVFSMVVECVPENLAKRITEAAKAPTISAGAGKYCDGQNLNLYDILGVDDSWAPKFVKKYANLNKTIRDAITQFKEEVTAGAFPDEAHTYH